MDSCKLEKPSPSGSALRVGSIGVVNPFPDIDHAIVVQINLLGVNEICSEGEEKQAERAQKKLLVSLAREKSDNTA
jgi:hypothetical protein